MKKVLPILAITASASAWAGPSVDHYGFILGTYQIANKDLGNLYKPTSVQDHTSATDLDKEGRSQFNFSKSRFGLKATDGAKVTGKLEFDFDGTDNGNAVQDGDDLRIRQANLSYAISENGKITLGKKWTKFMGVLPHTYGVTTVNFNAGNTGFIQDGVDYTHKFGNLALAVELSDAYAGTEDTNALSGPVMTLNLDYKTETMRAGFAYTSASLAHKVQNTATNKDSDASGMKVYTQLKPMANLDFAAEYFSGENLASIHAGGLASASLTDDLKHKTSGYFASLKYSMDKVGIFGNYGASVWGTAEDAGANKMSANKRLGLGLDYKCQDALTFFAEYAQFTTTWNQATATETKDTDGTLLELGMMYKF